MRTSGAGPRARGFGPLFLSVTLSCSFLQAAPEPTVLAGVYTPAQARRGLEVYTAQCAACHRADLGGFSGPPLKGALFLDRWREFKLEVLFNLVKNTMPANNAGGLPHASYLDVLAYLLESNEIPPGQKELTDHVIADTLLVGKDGPQPLPTGAQVSAIGCLTLDTGNGWFLTHSSEPARTFDTFQTAPEELKEAATKSLGDQLFRLANIDELPNFDRDAMVDNKVQAKGILVRQPNNARINITSLVKVGSGCEE
ncbi:MAG TPA: cytochrome c [Bryobacteraceae bacterium]